MRHDKNKKKGIKKTCETKKKRKKNNGNVIEMTHENNIEFDNKPTWKQQIT